MPQNRVSDTLTHVTLNTINGIVVMSSSSHHKFPIMHIWEFLQDGYMKINILGYMLTKMTTPIGVEHPNKVNIIKVISKLTVLRRLLNRVGPTGSYSRPSEPPMFIFHFFVIIVTYWSLLPVSYWNSIVTMMHSKPRVYKKTSGKNKTP